MPVTSLLVSCSLYFQPEIPKYILNTILLDTHNTTVNAALRVCTNITHIYSSVGSIHTFLVKVEFYNNLWDRLVQKIPQYVCLWNNLNFH